MTDPRLARPLWRGRTNVDALTIAALEKAEEICGKTFLVTQGSYQGGHGDLNSAGTHDLGGALDLRWTGDADDIAALRRAGFAAWHRTSQQGPWPDHIHAVLVDHPYMAEGARKQVDAYRAGRNGLANNGTDDGPRISPIPVFRWQEEDDMKPEDFDRIQKMIDASVDRTVKAVLDAKVGADGETLKQAVRRASDTKAIALDVARELGKSAKQATKPR